MFCSVKDAQRAIGKVRRTKAGQNVASMQESRQRSTPQSPCIAQRCHQLQSQNAPFTGVSQGVGKSDFRRLFSTVAVPDQGINQDATIPKKQRLSNSTPTGRIQKFQKMHDRLLKVPLQAYTPQLWNEGKVTLYFWMSQLSQEVQEGQETVYKPIAKHDHVHVNLCIQLLDRWALEENGPPEDIFEGTNADSIKSSTDGESPGNTTRRISHLLKCWTRSILTCKPTIGCKSTSKH
jgi:hypothetical protein